MIKCKCMFRILTLLAIYIIFTTKSQRLCVIKLAKPISPNHRISSIRGGGPPILKQKLNVWNIFFFQIMSISMKNTCF